MLLEMECILLEIYQNLKAYVAPTLEKYGINLEEKQYLLNTT